MICFGICISFARSPCTPSKSNDNVVLSMSRVLEKSMTFRCNSWSQYLYAASFRAGRLWSGRAAALAACSLGLLLMQFYGAALLASVLTPPPPPIRSLTDLLRSRLRYKVEDVSYQRQFFADNMDRPDIAALYRDKILRAPDQPFIGYDEGLRRVLTEDLAFQVTRLIHHAMRKSKNPFLKTPSRLFSSGSFIDDTHFCFTFSK